MRNREFYGTRRSKGGCSGASRSSGLEGLIFLLFLSFLFVSSLLDVDGFIFSLLLWNLDSSVEMFPSLGVPAVFTLGTEEPEPSSALHIQLTITSDLQGLTDILVPYTTMSPSAAILQLQKPTYDAWHSLL